MSVHKNKTVHLGKKNKHLYCTCTEKYSTSRLSWTTFPAVIHILTGCFVKSAVVHWLKSMESDFALSLIVPV